MSETVAAISSKCSSRSFSRATSSNDQAATTSSRQTSLSTRRCPDLKRGARGFRSLPGGAATGRGVRELCKKSSRLQRSITRFSGSNSRFRSTGNRALTHRKTAEFSRRFYRAFYHRIQIAEPFPILPVFRKRYLRIWCRECWPKITILSERESSLGTELLCKARRTAALLPRVSRPFKMSRLVGGGVSRMRTRLRGTRTPLSAARARPPDSATQRGLLSVSAYIPGD